MFRTRASRTALALVVFTALALVINLSSRIHASAPARSPDISTPARTNVHADRPVPVSDAGRATSNGECQPQWLPTFGSQPGVDATVVALTVFDDGSGGGPALYTGGVFTSAGGVSASYIAKWDGASWSALGSGMNGVLVHALAVFDDGSGGGPALYAGGLFTSAGGVTANYIAKWDGASWSAVGGGMNNVVLILTVFDDGSGGGPALYTGGSFATAGGVSASRIAKWDGSSWSGLGSGMNGGVSALTVFDDGSGGGPALYAGGDFTSAGGVRANFIAKWDGSAWSALGSGMNGGVADLTVFDDGSGGGPSLYASGFFTTAGGVSANHIAKWDGSGWSALGQGTDDWIIALTVFDDGVSERDALYAAGSFTTAGGVNANRIAKWDGISWSSLGNGVGFWANALAEFDDGSGPVLYGGGSFTTAGSVSAHYIAKWDDSAWSALGTGMNSWVGALAVFDDRSGSGPALCAGGWFTTPGGGVSANRIARWDGFSWSPLGTGMNSVINALTVLDDGSGAGPALYAGGWFTAAGGVAANRIARWDGSSWSGLGTGMSEHFVSALTVFNDGAGSRPALYAGGYFTTADGMTVNHIAKWDGSLWSAVASGVNSTVLALAVFDDGSGAGPALYAGGNFTTASGVSANRIAKWDGSSWSALSSGMDDQIRALAVFDDGSAAGPALYAGGMFTTAGGVSTNRIAKWDGSSWSALGSGVDDRVYAAAVFDDGSGAGPALYVAGEFTIAGGVTVNRVAKWDGSSWSTLASGTNDRIHALTVFDAGSGAAPALYAGGAFTVSPAGDSFLARWQGCPIEPAIPGDVNGDGVVNELDLMELLPCFGLPALPPDCAQGEDVNGDGVVNVLDLIELLLNFGATAP